MFAPRRQIISNILQFLHQLRTTAKTKSCSAVATHCKHRLIPYEAQQLADQNEATLVDNRRASSMPERTANASTGWYDMIWYGRICCVLTKSRHHAMPLFWGKNKFLGSLNWKGWFIKLLHSSSGFCGTCQAHVTKKNKFKISILGFQRSFEKMIAFWKSTEQCCMPYAKFVNKKIRRVYELNTTNDCFKTNFEWNRMRLTATTDIVRLDRTFLNRKKLMREFAKFSLPLKKT